MFNIMMTMSRYSDLTVFSSFLASSVDEKGCLVSTDVEELDEKEEKVTAVVADGAPARPVLLCGISTKQNQQLTFLSIVAKSSVMQSVHSMPVSGRQAGSMLEQSKYVHRIPGALARKHERGELVLSISDLGLGPSFEQDANRSSSVIIINRVVEHRVLIIVAGLEIGASIDQHARTFCIVDAMERSSLIIVSGMDIDPSLQQHRKCLIVGIEDGCFARVVLRLDVEPFVE